MKHLRALLLAGAAASAPLVLHCSATATRRSLSSPLEAFVEFDRNTPFSEDLIMSAAEPLNEALFQEERTAEDSADGNPDLRCDDFGAESLRRRWKKNRTQQSLLPFAPLPYSLQQRDAQSQQPIEREAIRFGFPSQEMTGNTDYAGRPDRSLRSRDFAVPKNTFNFASSSQVQEDAAADPASNQGFLTVYPDTAKFPQDGVTNNFDSSAISPDSGELVAFNDADNMGYSLISPHFSDVEAADEPQDYEYSTVTADTSGTMGEDAASNANFWRKSSDIAAVNGIENAEFSTVSRDTADIAAVNGIEDADFSTVSRDTADNAAVNGIEDADISTVSRATADNAAVNGIENADFSTVSRATANNAAVNGVENADISTVSRDTGDNAVANAVGDVDFLTFTSDAAESANSPAAVSADTGKAVPAQLADSGSSHENSKEVSDSKAVSAEGAESKLESAGGETWWQSFLKHLAFASAAQSAAMGGLFWPYSSALSKESGSAAETPKHSTPVAGWGFLSAGNWRRNLSAFFDKLDKKLEEGGPLLYSEVFDYTL